MNFIELIKERVLCPACRKLLLRGRMEGEIKCSRCGYLARFKIVDKEKGKAQNAPD